MSGGRFYEIPQEGMESIYAFDSGDGLDMALDQDNYWVWLSRSEPYMDMAQVTDPRDDLSWYWFRYQLGNEQFSQLDMMARKVGSVVLRETPTEDVQQVFANMNNFEDVDEHLEELEQGDGEG